MSSASIPPPRTGSSSAPRQSFFWPIFIYLLGALALSFYQVQSLEDQLGEVTSAYDRLDPQVKSAEYEKAKFYALARDLVRMAPKHPAADEIVNRTGLRTLQRTQPVLMSLEQPAGFTNAAPTVASASLPAETPANSTNTGPTPVTQ